IISCPSCSRVENEAFIELARDVKTMSEYASKYRVTIAIMGCRVNGPGETDDADIGLWCGPLGVNLKRGEAVVGHYPYDTVLGQVRTLLDDVIATKGLAPTS
ncbi:MAG: 4-hydroxy-3-methylbut-2-en-1-yl diphosphate synthase, partial [Chloroflexi bacterium]